MARKTPSPLTKAASKAPKADVRKTPTRFPSRPDLVDPNEYWAKRYAEGKIEESFETAGEYAAWLNFSRWCRSHDNKRLTPRGELIAQLAFWIMYSMDGGPFNLLGVVTGYLPRQTNPDPERVARLEEFLQEHRRSLPIEILVLLTNDPDHPLLEPLERSLHTVASELIDFSKYFSDYEFPYEEWERSFGLRRLGLIDIAHLVAAAYGETYDTAYDFFSLSRPLVEFSVNNNWPCAELAAFPDPSFPLAPPVEAVKPVRKRAPRPKTTSTEESSGS